MSLEGCDPRELPMTYLRLPLGVILGKILRLVIKKIGEQVGWVEESLFLERQLHGIDSLRLIIDLSISRVSRLR